MTITSTISGFTNVMLNSTVSSTSSASAITSTNSKLPIILPKNKALRSMGDSSSASRLPRSFSAARLRPRPNSPANTIATHSTPLTVLLRASLSSSSARLKISTVMKVNSSIELIISRLRISARRSFHTIAPTARRYGVTGRCVLVRGAACSRGVDRSASALTVSSPPLLRQNIILAARRARSRRSTRRRQSCPGSGWRSGRPARDRAAGRASS